MVFDSFKGDCLHRRPVYRLVCYGFLAETGTISSGVISPESIYAQFRLGVPLYLEVSAILGRGVRMANDAIFE